jgi:hypothetical protein
MADGYHTGDGDSRGQRRRYKYPQPALRFGFPGALGGDRFGGA